MILSGKLKLGCGFFLLGSLRLVEPLLVPSCDLLKIEVKQFQITPRVFDLNAFVVLYRGILFMEIHILHNI